MNPALSLSLFKPRVRPATLWVWVGHALTTKSAFPSKPRNGGSSRGFLFMGQVYADGPDDNRKSWFSLIKRSQEGKGGKMIEGIVIISVALSLCSQPYVVQTVKAKKDMGESSAY